MQLTPRQSALLSFIRSKLESRGYAPSIREMCEEFHYRSPNGVYCHLKALRQKGALTWEPKSARSFRVLETTRLERAEALLRDVLVDLPSVSAERIREYFGDGDKIPGDAKAIERKSE